MLKLEYEIMYKVAKTKILTLGKLVRLQNDEIIELKKENQRLKEGSKYFALDEVRGPQDSESVQRTKTRIY